MGKLTLWPVLTFGLTAKSEEHVVTANLTSFNPLVVFAMPGDTIRWTNMTGHDTESIDGMILTGAQKWRSKLGEDHFIVLDKDGAYIYKCNPHIASGM